MDVSRIVRDTLRHQLDLIAAVVSSGPVDVREVPGLVRTRVGAADRLHDAAVALLAADRDGSGYAAVLGEFVEAVAEYGAARPDRVTGRSS